MMPCFNFFEIRCDSVGKITWTVCIQHGGREPFGEVRWSVYSNAYAFYPDRHNTMAFTFEKLQEIADFCEQRTAEHKDATTQDHPSSPADRTGLG